MSVLLYAALALGTVAVAVALHLWLSNRRLQEASRSGLQRIYSPLPSIPELQVSSSYGHPVFTVIFRNHPLLQRAHEEGLNQAFVQFIGELCKNVKPRGEPFNPELAVSFEHENKLTQAEAGLE